MCDLSGSRVWRGGFFFVDCAAREGRICVPARVWSSHSLVSTYTFFIAELWLIGFTPRSSDIFQVFSLLLEWRGIVLVHLEFFTSILQNVCNASERVVLSDLSFRSLSHTCMQSSPEHECVPCDDSSKVYVSNGPLGFPTAAVCSTIHIRWSSSQEF